MTEARKKPTVSERLDLVERDMRDHAKTIGAIVSQQGKGFTPEQIEQISTVVTRAFADAGLRAGDTEEQDEAREDFRFVRRLRRFTDTTASKIGWIVIAACVGAVIWLVNAGLNAWRNF